MARRHTAEKSTDGGGIRPPRGQVDRSEIRRKLSRLRAGGQPTAIDMFSGCGGISLGAGLAGVRPLAGLDIDRPSMRSWWYNLNREKGLHLNWTPKSDVTGMSAAEALSQLRIDCGPQGVDLVVGGPPCQAYSRIGKGKLASLQNEDHAHLSDGRGMLFEEFLRFVREIAPVGVLVENVPDAMNYGGKVIPAIICESLARMGYRAHFTVLNSANYGVPQTRERIFILALHEEASDAPPPFPAPTHKITRDPEARLATHRIVKVVEDNPQWGVLPPMAGEDLPEAVSVHDALGDLPMICSMDRKGGGLGCSDMRTGLPYAGPPTNEYQTLMRTWTGLPRRTLVDGNVLRDNPRDFPVFARMQEGDQYPEARRIHEMLFMEEIARLRATGRRIEEGDPAWLVLRREMVPPYDDTKFESKWYKMRRDRPSRTVVAHLQMDTYSHIHYDSQQARAVTVREAARLQSFPDGFSLIGSMKEGFRQVGNAVPPLMACHLTKALLVPLRAARG